MGKHPKVFNNMFVNIVKAGESAGVLDKVMFQLAEFIAHDLSLEWELLKLSDTHLLWLELLFL